MSSSGVIGGRFGASRQLLGTGSYAKVVLGKNLQTDELVAIKIVSLDKLRRAMRPGENASRQSSKLIAEIGCLRRLDHPNIVKLFASEQTQRHFYLVLEYCAGGDLTHPIQRARDENKRISEHQARRVINQLAAGLRAMRALDIIHRDIKPANLLLTTPSLDSATVKIADFGFARSVPSQSLADTICGTPLYMAPEVFKRVKYDGKADLWSVGAVLFEILCGKPPFYGTSAHDLARNIETGEYLSTLQSSHLSESCMRLISSLLTVDPAKRLNYDDFFSHPWLSEGNEESAGGGDISSEGAVMVRVKSMPSLHEATTTTTAAAVPMTTTPGRLPPSLKSGKGSASLQDSAASELIPPKTNPFKRSGTSRTPDASPLFFNSPASPPRYFSTPSLVSSPSPTPTPAYYSAQNPPLPPLFLGDQQQKHDVFKFQSSNSSSNNNNNNNNNYGSPTMKNVRNVNDSSTNNNNVIGNTILEAANPVNPYDVNTKPGSSPRLVGVGVGGGSPTIKSSEKNPLPLPPSPSAPAHVPPAIIVPPLPLSSLSRFPPLAPLLVSPTSSPSICSPSTPGQQILTSVRQAAKKARDAAILAQMMGGGYPDERREELEAEREGGGGGGEGGGKEAKKLVSGRISPVQLPPEWSRGSDSSSRESFVLVPDNLDDDNGPNTDRSVTPTATPVIVSLANTAIGDTTASESKSEAKTNIHSSQIGNSAFQTLFSKEQTLVEKQQQQQQREDEVDGRGGNDFSRQEQVFNDSEQQQWQQRPFQDMLEDEEEEEMAERLFLEEAEDFLMCIKVVTDVAHAENHIRSNVRSSLCLLLWCLRGVQQQIMQFDAFAEDCGSEVTDQARLATARFFLAQLGEAVQLMSRLSASPPSERQELSSFIAERESTNDSSSSAEEILWRQAMICGEEGAGLEQYSANSEAAKIVYEKGLYLLLALWTVCPAGDEMELKRYIDLFQERLCACCGFVDEELVKRISRMTTINGRRVA